MKKLLIIATLFLLLFSTIFSMGRMYEIKGIVVFMDEDKQAWFLKNVYEMNREQYPEIGNPIPQVKITFFYALDKNDQPIRDTIWQKTIYTNDKGIFAFSDYAAPSKKAKIGVELVCEGYTSLYFTYIDYIEKEQYFFIILEKPPK